MQDDEVNVSGKYWLVKDHLENRFRLRCGGLWSDELWDELKRLCDAGEKDAGFALLPCSAPNLQLVSYNAFHPKLVLNDVDEETGRYKTVEMKNSKMLVLMYAFDADGDKIRFNVYIENGKFNFTDVNDVKKLDTLAQYDPHLADRLAHSAAALLP